MIVSILIKIAIALISAWATRHFTNKSIVKQIRTNGFADIGLNRYHVSSHSPRH